MKKILLIDDEEKLRKLLARLIRLEDGLEVEEAANCREAEKHLEQGGIELVLCDVKLPDGDGIDFSSKIKKQYAHLQIIILTAYGNIPDGVQSIKNGAFHYLVKGNDNHQIIPLIHQALAQQTTTHKSNTKHNFGSIVGQSELLHKAIQLAKRVAETDSTVLLTGETGTGKEVFAQAIHQQSSRSKQPFVAVNCAAFSKELLESELFGYKTGAFTGANKDKKGLFEEANRGSIFLDEVGEMPFELQAKLLRVLEAGELLRVGESKTTKIDVRVIAATNRNLQQEIEAGHFRRDLFYRLSVFQIHLPALRERPEDIELLARYFMQYFAQKMGKKIESFSDAFLAFLRQHTWQGNIRELRNVMERSVILADGATIEADTLPIELQSSHADAVGGGNLFALSSVEKIHIQKVLEHTQQNKAEAARLLGIGLTTLYRKIEEYKLRG